MHILHLYDQTYTHKPAIMIYLLEIRNIQNQKKDHVSEAWRIELDAQICK